MNRLRLPYPEPDKTFAIHATLPPDEVKATVSSVAELLYSTGNLYCSREELRAGNTTAPGNVVTDELSQASSKVVDLALNGLHTHRKFS